MAFPPVGNPPLANPVVVIAPHFCAPYPVDLTITKKFLTLREGAFAVIDVNGNLIFKVKGSILSLHDRRVLLDASDNPLITLQQKILSAHRRWQVYKGESTDEKDLLFTVRKSKVLQLKTQLHVFLASNTNEDAPPDFIIKGSWFGRTCTIYYGETTTIVAQMHKKHSVESVMLGKDTFMVTVYPNIDYAFIVALINILYEINEDRSGKD